MAAEKRWKIGKRRGFGGSQRETVGFGAVREGVGGEGRDKAGGEDAGSPCGVGNVWTRERVRRAGGPSPGYPNVALNCMSSQNRTLWVQTHPLLSSSTLMLFAKAQSASVA